MPGGTLIALVPHMDAGHRHTWRGDQNERPLSELGQRQAEALAVALAEEYEIQALFASTAARAKQTLEPLSAQLGLAIQIEPLLCEKQLGESKQTLGERGLQALQTIRAAVGEGVAVAAAHGDIIPATAELLGSGEVLMRRGQWYELVFDERDIAVTMREAAKFPL